MAASTVSEHLCLVIGDHATAKASGRIEGSRLRTQAAVTRRRDNRHRQRTHAAAMRRRDNRHGGGCLAARTCMSRPRPLPEDLPDASRRRPRGRGRLRPRESSRLLPHERLDALPRVASWRRAPSPSTCASRLAITRPRKPPVSEELSPPDRARCRVMPVPTIWAEETMIACRSTQRTSSGRWSSA